MENNFKTKGNPLPENFKTWFDFYESLSEYLKEKEVIIVSDIFDSTYILSKNSLFPNKNKHSEFLLVDIKENVLNELIEEIVEEINAYKLDSENQAKAEKTLKERINKIESIGFILDEEKQEWNGFGCNIVLQKLQTINDDQMETFGDYLENAKKADQAEKERQELLVKDKMVLELFILEIQNEFIQFDSESFENAEMQGYFSELRKDVVAYLDEKIVMINKY